MDRIHRALLLAAVLAGGVLSTAAATPGSVVTPLSAAIAAQGNLALQAIRQEAAERVRGQRPAHPREFLPQSVRYDPAAG